MDFKRIEWIFLVAFLFLNIFLFGIYNNGKAADNSPVSIESIEKRLTKDGISFEGELSSKKIEGYYLSAEQTDFNQIDKSALNGQWTIADELLSVEPFNNYYIDLKNLTGSLNTFLKDGNLVLFGSEYKYLAEFSYLEAEFPEANLFQSYKGIPFYDDTAQLSLHLQDTGKLLKVASYEQTHVQGIEELREKMDIYSQKEAVETLYINNKIPSKSKILFSKLAYARIYQIREKNVYVPVWFIGIQSDKNKTAQLEQVNAVSNTVITNNSVPIVENET